MQNQFGGMPGQQGGMQSQYGGMQGQPGMQSQYGGMQVGLSFGCGDVHFDAATSVGPTVPPLPS